MRPSSLLSEAPDEGRPPGGAVPPSGGGERPFGRRAAVRAMLMLTGSTHVSYLLGLACSAMIARHLGPADYGRYAYLVWLSGLVVMLCNNGLTTTAIRFVAESVGRGAPDDAHRVRRHLQRRQYRDVVICSVLLGVALPWMSPSGWEGHLWGLAVIVLCSAIPKALYLFDISVAKGWGDFGVEARTTVIVTMASTLAIAVAAWRDASLDVFLWLFVAAGIAHHALAHWRLRGRGLLVDAGGPLQASLGRRVDRHLWWTVVLCVVAAFSNRSIETMLLNAYVGPAEVGFFAIAVALSRGGVELLCAGPNAIVMPAMGHAYGVGGFAAVSELMARTLRYFTFLGLLLVGVGVGMSQAAIDIVYGSAYQPAVDVLRLLMVAGGLTLPMGVLGALLSTTDNQKLRAAVAAVSLGISALAAWALIPRWGLDGAMLASAASSVLIFVAVLTATARWLSLRLPWRELSRLYGAAAVAALASVALARGMAAGAVPAGLSPASWQATAQAACGLVFALLFVLSTVWLRAWNQADAAPIRAVGRRMPGGPRARAWIERWIDRLPPSFR